MKTTLTCFVIDDEPLAEEILSEYIKKVSFLKLTGSFGSALDAFETMKSSRPDILFLDINMPDLDGLSFISMLDPKPHIVLTTAYDQYALKAFELEVKDYLLKPISFERFYMTVSRLYQSLSRKEGSEQQSGMKVTIQPEKDFIFIQSGTRMQKVDVKDIILIEGMKDYLRIHTLKDKIMTLLTFAKLEEMLPTGRFCRVHKSYMVSIDKIDHVEKSRIKIADQIIPVSDTYAEKLLKILKGLD